VSVTNSEQTLECSSKWGSCRVRYDELQTPMYIDTVPNQVFWGMTINMIMNPNRCHNPNYLPDGSDPFYYLKIGDTLTDWEGWITSETRMPDWQSTQIVTVVGKNRPIKSADPDVSFNKFGRVNKKETSLHCNFAGDECWRIRVHPKIDSINAATGYKTGGQTMIIKGHGLKGLTTSVSVDGVACVIDAARSTDEQVVCETGSKDAESTLGA